MYDKRLCDCFKYILKTKFLNPYKTLESTGEMKLMINFTCVCTILWALKLIFKVSEFPWVFGAISGNYLYLQLLENSKRT